MSKFTLMTKAGYEKMKQQLEEMKTTGRQTVAAAIGEAREKGDLSENAEYEAAKDAQGMLEAKISEMDGVMSNVRIIDESLIDASKAGLLTYVTIKNRATNKEMTFQLVPESEADLKTQKLSIASPMGQGLLGKAIGEIAYVKTPNGNIEFEMLNIFI